MKKNIFTLSVITVLLAVPALILTRQTTPFMLETAKGKVGALQSKAELAADAAKWRFDRLKDENGNFYPGYVSNAIKQADSYNSVSRSGGLGLQWQELGPDNVGGRTRAILIDKRDTTNNTIYAGGVTGGMWKSTDGGVTWQRLTAWTQWTGIASIAQAPAPDFTIYVGTGAGLDYSGFANWGGSSYFSGGYGNGIFKLDANDNPVLITPDVFTDSIYNPAANNSPWWEVNRIAINAANPSQIIAGTMAGLYKSTNGGSTWTQITFPSPLNTYQSQFVDDVKWSSDGKNIIAAFGQNLGNNKLIYSNDGGTTWSLETHATNSGYPVTASGRIELAIAPSNPQIIYAVMATIGGGTMGLYKSADGGKTWTTCVVGGPSFQLFEEGGGASPQGWYDNTIGVSPGDADKVYMGGVNFYTYSSADGLTAADVGYSNESNPYYLHPDKHAIVIAENNPDLMFIGCDGGIFKSENAAAAFPLPTYTARNRGYNVTQNYGIGAGIMGDVIGGSQDNGTNYINYNGNSFGAATQVLGGDGIVNAVSQINPDFWFGGIYYADLFRSADHANTWGGMFDVKIDPAGQGGASVCGANNVSGDAQFITPYYLGETNNAVNGLKTVTFTASQTYLPGEVTQVTSLTGNAQFTITLSDSLKAGSTLMIADPYRSRLFLSTDCGVFVTSEALNIAAIPRWFKLAEGTNGVAESFVTTPDGDNLFVGTTTGLVYKFSNLNARADTATYPAGTSVGVLYQSNSPDISVATVAQGLPVEGLAVDPADNNHVVAAVAGFSANATQPHVYESHDGGTTWTGLVAGLPDMPVYSVVIHDANTIIIGTELGVWSWDGSSWHEENSNGFERVPVYRIIERPLYTGGCNVLYLGAHGRGMWRSTTLTPTTCQTAIGTSVNNVKSNAITGLSVFPNPIKTTGKVSLTIDVSAKVTLRVFDMTGKLYSETNYHDVSAGTNTFDLNTSGLGSGSYLLAATLADERTISKLFVVAK